jgi:hypothetical protein
LKWRSFRRYIKRRGVETFTDLAVAFHFRIATHGSKVERNCHPFHINENLAMMHNGVMRQMEKYIDDDSDISDSEAFVDRYLKQAFSSIDITALQGGQPINDLFDVFVGASKLLFMDNEGEVAIVNERVGTWSKYGLGKDMWFSNTRWKPIPKAKTSSASKSVGKGSTTIKYDGDFRVVESWENGRKMVKKYSKKTGVLLSTSYSHDPLPPPVPYKDRADDHVSRYKPNAFNIDDEDDDWYCLECHSFFRRGDAKRSYWTNGLAKRIVDCPECGDSNTCEGEELYRDFEKNNETWLCFLCDADFYADEMSVSGSGETRCPICYSPHIYKSEEHHLVQRFGQDYFDAEVIEPVIGH